MGRALDTGMKTNTDTKIDRETISPVMTHFTGPCAEISIIATALQAEAFGGLTRREAIDRARVIVVKRGGA
jgi:hypothetical protein